MARHKSDDRRNLILAATAKVVAAQGLGAATAAIAKEAAVSHGSLFTYFKTKSELFNELYLTLKKDLATTAGASLPNNADLRTQLFHVWSHWIAWGVTHPSEFRALAQLSVSDQITVDTRQAASKISEGGLELVRQVGALGALKDLPPTFVIAIIEGMAATTIEFMSREPERADECCASSFEALWRALT